jgi:hypothetical protein
MPSAVHEGLFWGRLETDWISKAFVGTLARWRMMTQHLLAQEMDSIEMVDGADPRG